MLRNRGACENWSMKKSLNKRPWRIISGGQTGVDCGGDLCAIGDDGDLVAWMDAEFVAELEDEQSQR